MTKLIRFDEDHFGFMVDRQVTSQRAEEFGAYFASYWPGKKLIVMQVDEFIDLTGKYEIIPMTDVVQ